ncbi:phage adaptor protein [Bradyrhizobium japonicum]|uniref:phage adaptor protein n=1 Tax=Bradyrhizobium japonicum TaxID=375 RepID=UPI001BA8C37D|nr:hypothetical protein [Bradyrhizobium japonicum]MBR0913124.1 hypothetical protein [Bradyrhizobium japonicum]
MSVLSAAQSAGIRLIGEKPISLFAPTGANVRFANELADLATETATDIAKQHDWRALTKLNTITGDGSSLAFDLPSDYDRMPLKAEVYSATWNQWRYNGAKDLDQWNDILNFFGTGIPGWWIILGGQFQITQGAGVALPVGTNARFYYISNQIAEGKKAFTADTDAFVLDERLLMLGLIWRWRAQKRQEYGEDMKNYELALEKEIARDKGSRLLVTGPQRFPANVSNPYPGALGQ